MQVGAVPGISIRCCAACELLRPASAQLAVAARAVRTGVQERLAKLEQKAREEDRHDSTLVFDDDDAEHARKSEKDLDLERRKQLTKFVDSLNALKGSTGGQTLPGFDASFLQDPRLPSTPSCRPHACKPLFASCLVCAGLFGRSTIQQTKH